MDVDDGEDDDGDVNEDDKDTVDVVGVVVGIAEDEVDEVGIGVDEGGIAGVAVTGIDSDVGIDTVGT